MRLKSRQSGGGGGGSMRSGGGSTTMQHEDELLNGSNASSTSSASGVDPNEDDLDLDSGDDDIDVGTNADSIGFGERGGNSESATNLIMNGSMDGTGVMYGSSSSSSGHHQVISFGSLSEADRKRAHHNALERKRRDHIKDSFHTLRDAIPNIRGEKKHILKTSRAQILKAATEYIKQIRTRNADFHSDIDTLRRQNAEIENQIRQLERAKISCSGGILSENNHHTKIESTSLFDHYDIVADHLKDTTTTTPTTTSIKFEPTEPSSTATLTTTAASLPKFNVITSGGNGGAGGSMDVKQQPATIQIATTTKGATSSNGVLVLNKPIITATGHTAGSPGSAATKKFKTIINTKNNINIINLNHAKLATSTSSSAASTLNATNTMIGNNPSFSSSSANNNNN